jgi:hypothetical protein
LNNFENNCCKGLSAISDSVSQLSSDFKSSNFVDYRCLDNAGADCLVLVNELKLTRSLCNQLRDDLSLKFDTINNIQPKSSGTNDDINCSSLQEELCNTAEVGVPPLIDLIPETSRSSNNTAKNSHFSLRVVVPPKNKNIFVSRFITSTTHLDILSHIKSILVQNNVKVDDNSIKCKNISRFNGKVASFKITVPEAMFDLLISPYSWPISTFVKEFKIISNDRVNNSLIKTSKN